ncbi:DUF1697 domain-containing protein [soil metagenome]
MSATTWVALLRGINVGRNKRVAMADLRSLLESLGYADVRTHLQSGNALFTSSAGEAELEAQITSRIESDLGLDVAVIVRRSDELAAVVDANPFVERGVDQKELHAVFLSATPAEDLATLDHDDYAPDEFEVGERVLYLRLPGGVMASRLPDWARLLRGTITQRSWKTVVRLRDLATG